MNVSINPTDWWSSPSAPEPIAQMQDEQPNEESPIEVLTDRRYAKMTKCDGCGVKGHDLTYQVSMQYRRKSVTFCASCRVIVLTALGVESTPEE